MLLEGFFTVLSNILLFTSKIDNNNSFPHPLSSEKEAEYLAKFKAGDMSARDILIKHNLRLVAYIAKKYTNYPDQEELVSVGSLGLMKAINTYELGKGTQLATYASRCIENEILMCLRSQRKLAGTISLYENVGRDKDGNETELIDILSIDEETVYASLENEMVKNAILKLIDKHLSPREKKIVLLRFGLQDALIRTQQEVSDILKISRSYVSRIEKSALEKLKAGMADDGFQL